MYPPEGSVPKVLETSFDLVVGGILILCKRIFVKNKKIDEKTAFADHCSICAHPLSLLVNIYPGQPKGPVNMP